MIHFVPDSLYLQNQVKKDDGNFQTRYKQLEPVSASAFMVMTKTSEESTRNISSCENIRYIQILEVRYQFVLYEASKNGIQYTYFFGEMMLDLARELPELWNDIHKIARKNGYIVDIQFNVISLYQEYDSKLSVIKITTGRDRHVKNVIKRVFEKTSADPVEEHEMIGVDGKLPIWKRTGPEEEPAKR